MYSPQSVSTSYDSIQSHISSLPNPKDRFTLTYHSREETLEMTDHLNSKIDYEKYRRKLEKDGKTEIEWIEELDEFDIQWIENERTLCQIDAGYWLTRYYWIKDFHTQSYILFDFNIAQQIQFDIIGELEDKLRAIRILLLKARQLGGSTFWQGLAQHRTCFYNDTIAIAGSGDEKSAEQLTEMLFNSWNRQPFWLVPERDKHDTGSYYKFSNGSTLDLAWGTQKRGIGRGRTPNVSHLSEVAEYKDPVNQIEAALIRAMHETVWLLQCFESTANGRDNWLHKLWKSSQRGYETGENSLYPLFMPWFVGRDLYPTEAFLRGRNFESWSPKIETIAHARRAEEYVQIDPFLRKYLNRLNGGGRWVMPREQMFFYELEKKRHIENDILHIFLQEMPADPEEAFQNSTQGIISIEITSDMENRVKAPIGVYKIRGNVTEIPAIIQPEEHEIDGEKEVIRIRPNLGGAGRMFECELVPVKYEGTRNFDPRNKIVIWEGFRGDREKGIEYGFTVDTSDGLGEKRSDNSVIEGIRKGTIREVDEQVLEFASPDLSASELWPVTIAVGSLFSSKAGDYQPLFIIEKNKGGVQTQRDMQTRGWSNFYIPIELDKLDLGLKLEVNVIGWETDMRNRPLVINNFLKFIKGKWIQINSVFLIGEIKDLARYQSKLSDRVKIAAAHGKKDDRVMGCGIGLFCLHQTEILGFEKRSWEERGERSKNEITLGSGESGVELGRYLSDSTFTHQQRGVRELGGGGLGENMFLSRGGEDGEDLVGGDEFILRRKVEGRIRGEDGDLLDLLNIGDY